MATPSGNSIPPPRFRCPQGNFPVSKAVGCDFVKQRKSACPVSRPASCRADPPVSATRSARARSRLARAGLFLQRFETSFGERIALRGGLAEPFGGPPPVHRNAIAV